MPSLAEMIADPAIGLRVSLVIVACFTSFCAVCTGGLWFYLTRDEDDSPVAHGAQKRERLAA
jgi:hypothetical protein